MGRRGELPANVCSSLAADVARFMTTRLAQMA
jgi:hypothetical protein